MDCAPSALALRYRSGLFQPLRGLHIELAQLGYCATCGRWPFGLASRLRRLGS